MKILQSFPEPRGTTNPYLTQLRDALAGQGDLDVMTFSWPRALTEDYDLLHVHWPELLVRGRTRLRTAARRLLFLALMARLGWSGTPVVRTLHNASAHERGSWTEQRLLALCDRRTRLWIRLNDRTIPPRSGPVVTIVHGHYTDWYAQYDKPATVPGTLLFFGLLRLYKGLEELVDVFGGTADELLRLRVVGKPDSDEVRAVVERACATDARVSARLTYVDDRDLAAEIGRSELVVLPYRDMHNSGALLLALSLSRPVLVPATPVTEELASEVGTGWVFVYDGVLRAAHLGEALARHRDRGGRSAPDLGRRDWVRIGAAHRAAYEVAVAAPVGRTD